ncbi:polysaccharide biosynthesis tyrosine autokinase [Blastococcus sp. CT_GayMR20]|uniref:polysaccharide biosynthesis tyrosine autokinase n=1 Tax=Blastococcus sp. CT_GayMR20 TaxID=2559609 RepID=UPI0010744085|nr:polysaccharide biosynthesis tyrosine autokinase [Blastococcus sp. CT_GayMR20]TFV92707.1 polysaccharide biosynthesis tyrosine autokinase [Blastococcus sp. CT_GayMR20]TFV92712.1 polysaccharide biosynthesis tyrosine autokinase [Blastococcus sp. CT_GayMR20]
MDLKDVLNVVRSGWWLLVSGTLLGLVIAGALSWAATPLYSSSTRLFVSVAGTTDTSAAYQGNLFSQQRVTSYAELLTGEQLAAQVVDDLGLDLSPDAVAAKVAARALPDTVILEVTVTDTSAERARDIAASLSEQFTEQVTELETPEGADASTVKVTIVQAAELRPAAVSPSVTRNLALGAVLGLLIGLGLALLRSRLDNTVKSNDDVQALTGMGVIGTVLEDPRLDEKHVVTAADEHSPTAESFRAIRTNLQFLDVDNPPKVIVVASSVPGEGKSTLAVNLSTALAQSGSRVVLLEADLRRPRVTRYMGLVGGAGLTNVLAGTAELHEVLQPWGDGKLSVLAAGPMPPNPSEMLGSAHMRGVLATLREEYDFVVIDTPPLLPVTDAAVLSVAADGCVITTRYGSTRREQLEEAAAVLARIDAKLLGVVLNRVPQAASIARGYGYGYGYGADPGRAPIPEPKRGRPGRRTGRRRHSPLDSPLTSPDGGAPF